MRGVVGCVRRCWLEVIDNELEPDRTEKFGDSCVICAASVTVEDCGSATLALSCLRARTHVHGKNLHARTHGSARAHAKEDTYASAHTARTRNIRIRTCATPGRGAHILDIRRSKTGNPHRKPPALSQFIIIYQRRRLGCIATSRVAPPATRWPTALKTMMPHQGGEKCESPRSGPAARAALAHAVLSRTTAVRRFASPHLGLPLPPRVGRPCTCATCHTKGARNARVREPAPQRAPHLHMRS